MPTGELAVGAHNIHKAPYCAVGDALTQGKCRVGGPYHSHYGHACGYHAGTCRRLAHAITKVQREYPVKRPLCLRTSCLGKALWAAVQPTTAFRGQIPGVSPRCRGSRNCPWSSHLRAVDLVRGLATCSRGSSETTITVVR